MDAGDQKPWFEPLSLYQKLLLFFFLLLPVISPAMSFAGEKLFLFHDFTWAFGFSIAVIGPSFIMARRAALGKMLEKHVKSETVFPEMYEDYVRRQEKGWEPTIIGILAGAFFLCFRWWITWDLLPYKLDISRWIALVYGTIGYAFLGKTVWHFLAFGSLARKMGTELEIRQDKLFSWELLEEAGQGYTRTAFGISVLSFSIFWSIMATRQLFAGDDFRVAEQLHFGFFIFLLGTLLPILYFVLPQWGLHRILVQRKNQILSMFQEKLLSLERAFLANPDRKVAQEYINERMLVQEIRNLPEWPFRFGSLAQVVSIVAIPSLVFFFKEIIVEVIVELLKSR